MIDRFVWLLIRRHRLAQQIEGFWASRRSYADRRSSFSGYNRLYRETVVSNATLGRFTYITDAKISNAVVGSFCSVGPGAMIGGLGRHPTNWISTHPVFYSNRKQAGISFTDRQHMEEAPQVSIGNDVWIGANAIVLDGINIGDGAIIAAGAVVTNDIEPYSIVGGVPARLIRKRFDIETVARLQQMKWWDWPVNLLIERAHLFRSSNVDVLENLGTTVQ